MTKDEEIAHLLNVVSHNFVQEVDGFYYYCPKCPDGLLTSHQMRVIADELDRKNKDWEDYINTYLST